MAVSEQNRVDPLQEQLLQMELEAKVKEKDPKQWERNNQWLEKAEKILDSISVDDENKFQKTLQDFYDAKISFLELAGVDPKFVLYLAQYGYHQFKRNNLKEAEKIFQGLSMLDERNSYYYDMLGAVYQKMDEWLEAVLCYTSALELNPNDIVAYVNRGEIYQQYGYIDEPLEDFEKAIALDPHGRDRWANRARSLRNNLLQVKESFQQRGQ